MSTNSAADFNDKKVIASILFCGVIALLTFLLLPLYVGAMADKYGFSESQLGILASMDLGGIALMSLSGPFWIKRLNWRKVMRYSLVWLTIWNMVTVYTSDFGLLCLVRFLAGLGGGLMASLVIQSISYTLNPDRVAAIYIVLQVAIQSAAFLVLPGLIIDFGLLGFFGLLSIMGVLALAVTGYFPLTGLDDDVGDDANAEKRAGDSPISPLLILLGMAFFFIAQVALFSFVERMGVEAGFSSQQIGDALTIAVTVGLGGAILGAVVSVRYGRLLPILLAGIAQLACFIFMSPNIDLLTYTLLMCGFQFFWNLPLGYHVGVLIGEDKHHRFVLLIPFIQALGISIGPFLGGYALEFGGYDGLIGLACAALVFYLLLFVPKARRQDKIGYAGHGQ
ncbi:MAG: MFS transporter [Pseudomonadales bacterium]